MTKRQTEKKSTDIVAFLLDGHLLVREYRRAECVQVITRAHMRFMAACDLGPQWKALADAPAIARFKRGRPTDTMQRILP